MYLKHLEARDFRNYHQLKIEFSPQVNIFFGLNAQGKTNLLEAISILSLGRSFKTKKDSELINWESATSFLSGEYQFEIGTNLVEIGLGIKEKRYKLNGTSVKSSAIFGLCPLVTFTPDDLQLVKGGPQFRRDYIDLYLAQIDPKYRFIYYHFHQALQQRNRFLKERRRDQTVLDVWDEQLVTKGAKVIKYRLQLLESVRAFIADAHAAISGSQESLNIEYLCFNNEPLGNVSETEIKEEFYRRLQEVRSVEMERQLSLVGPQRDDLRLTLGRDIELRYFGSQGQQRTAALALKLGLIEKIKEARDEYPILLLDDVMSEFDDNRQHLLLKLLSCSSQTFLTSTSRRDFPIANRDTAFFSVVQGEVNQVE